LQALRFLFPALGVAFAAVAAFALFGGSADRSSLDDVVAGSSTSDSVHATVQPSPTPCPYCDQDTDRWQNYTTVAPPELLSNSAVLMEAGCGEVIYSRNARDRREPASLAKIATALAVKHGASLTDMVPITVDGWHLTVENNSSIMGLKPGMLLTVEELLWGLLLPSGNDAAIQLGLHVGSEGRLVDLMSQEVQKLGLTDTHLMNPHGLDAPGAYSTPFDMAVLGRELLQDPLLSQMVRTQFREEPWHEQGRLWNGNSLLYSYDGAIGIKTGYTEEAGWNIVSAAERGGRTLIVSVFDSKDIYWDSTRLLDWAFANVDSVC
jgi:serine-type D-Ala-D-Ala carboxypeptidase (penicillin-binding protein 5/6)